MIIDILTLFPEMFLGFVNSSIIKRAIEKQKITINIHNIRDYSPFKNKQVDDYAFGGGTGMVLMCEPIFNAIEDLRKEDSLVIMTTPAGKTFTQKTVAELKEHKHIIILCGHYEGFDERIKTLIDLELSIGDYVLTGGELPAMVITDAVTRLLPGVIAEESKISESFTDNLLDYPVYTRPADFRGLKVPDILLSGNHEKINAYRNEERIRVTKEKRNDLFEGD